MIRIDKVPFIPDLPYAAYAMKELVFGAKYLDEVEKASEGIWVLTADTPVLVLGVIRSSLLARPRLWFLLCEQPAPCRVLYRLKAIKTSLVELDKRYAQLETYVEEGWKAGERFAGFCGFRATPVRVEMYGRTFKVWER